MIGDAESWTCTEVQNWCRVQVRLTVGGPVPPKAVGPSRGHHWKVDANASWGRNALFLLAAVSTNPCPR